MTDVIVALSVMFIVAGVLLLVANHFGFSPIPFYIIAGLLVGPFIAQENLIEFAQWGIAFLVFVFGIRLDVSDIQGVLRDAEVAALVQILVVGALAFGVGYGFGYLFEFDDPVRNAIYFSAAATLSSTIVGSGVLQRSILDNLVYGRLASSIHFFDDIVAIGLILVLSAELLTDTQAITSNIGYGVLFLLAGLFMARHGYPLLVRAAEGFDELVLMGSISILIAFIAAAEAIGISIVIGAFAAGIAIGKEGAVSIGVENGINSIRDFFVAIFFVTIGALVSIQSIEILLLAGALALLVLVVNPIIIMLAFIYEGYDTRTSFLAALSLNQMSELSLIIAIEAWFLGTISDRLFDAIILAAVLTMLVTVVTKRYEDALYKRLISGPFGKWESQSVNRNSEVAEDISDHVIIVGYGRQGRQLAKRLEEIGEQCVVIENDPVLKEEVTRDCTNYVFGDAMATHTMEQANVSDARLVISTVSYKPVSRSLLELETDADLILRAQNSEIAKEYLDEGVLFVNVPSVLASDNLVEQVRRVLEDNEEITALQEQHNKALDTLERYGFQTKFDNP